jgi:GMP synthase (glutamine-hydrolysing)
MKPIALIKTGSTIREISRQHGDFEHWFAAAMNVSNWIQIDVYKHQSLPSPQGLSGVVITGSAAMVSDREDWSEATAEWLRVVVPGGTPVLGVCYGHQLIAHALGGKVGQNPAGRQIGTVTANLIEPSNKDALLGHLPARFAAQSSHQETVLEIPAGAIRLATSPLDDNFALRFSEHVWGVQFHPEFSNEVMSQYIHLRRGALTDEGLNTERLLNETRASEKARTVLQKFAEIVTRSATASNRSDANEAA